MIRDCLFEAMKMQHEILAPVSGVIRELNGQVGADGGRDCDGD